MANVGSHGNDLNHALQSENGCVYLIASIVFYSTEVSISLTVKNPHLLETLPEKGLGFGDVDLLSVLQGYKCCIIIE